MWPRRCASSPTWTTSPRSTRPTSPASATTARPAPPWAWQPCRSAPWRRSRRGGGDGGGGEQAGVIRCPWGDGEPLSQAYHDAEWGVPRRDDRTLFEFLV